VVLIGVIAGVCVLLLVAAFLAPRLSSGPQRGVDRAAGGGQRTAAKAPGPVGRLLQKPFRGGRQAADRSASLGRRGRFRLPF
jgi:hypothetical protein